MPPIQLQIRDRTLKTNGLLKPLRRALYSHSTSVPTTCRNVMCGFATYLPDLYEWKEEGAMHMLAQFKLGS